MYFDFEVGDAGSGCRGDRIRISEVALCCVYRMVPYGSIDMGELGLVGKRWTVHVVQRALCPLVCRSSGGQAESDDGCRCSFELPTHPCFAVH
jgi:hypothetical protein